MTTEEDIPYHWKSSLNQSYLESVIEKHTFTTNYTDITNKNDYNTMLEALSNSTNTNSSHQINTRIGSIHNLHENFTFLQNNLKNSRFRSSIKLCATIRKEHQREQDKNRTRTLNVAFCRLRSCLPEIPKDTKLTKIRTLRYAITYIKQLIELIHQTDPVSSSILMLDTGSNSLKVESEHDQSLMKDSGYLSFMDR
ncbi:Heart- and neural crest derivatives-expressed protein 2 [Schistosoma japonicum]|nr:Heart- and neural crest derivatives-expressed protein 2 [Schistosoma japonicum]